MKSDMFKKLLILFLIILSSFFIQNSEMNVPVYADNENDESVIMDVTYGIGGLFRNQEYIPINISIENNGETICGKVEVRTPTNEPGGYDAFVKDVNLEPGNKTKVVIPIIMEDSDQSKFSVILYNGENIIKQEKGIISSGRVNELDMLVGNLTEDFNGITFKNIDFRGYQYGQDKINKGVNMQIDQELFNENISCLDALDIILINNYDLSKWNNQEYESLDEWIQKGGTLILGTGENAVKTIGNIKNSFLDINYEKTRDINNYTLADFTLKDGIIRLKTEENPLIYSVNRGKGEIYVASFDLSNAAIASSKEVTDFWKTTLGNRFLSSVGRNRNYIHGFSLYQADSLIDNVPLEKEINFKALIILFISYAFICGILIYFIMKKLNKREYMWAVIPVIAVVFSVILYVMGSSTRVNDIILNQVNVIDIDKDGNSTIKGYAGIGAKYKSDLLIKKPADLNMQKYNDRHYMFSEDTSMVKLKDKTVYKGNDSYYEFNDLSSLTLKRFILKNHNEIVPGLDSELKFDSEKLTGKIKNNSGYDIEKLVLVSGVNVWDLGKVNGNEEINIESDKYVSFGLNRYSDLLRDNYWNNYVNYPDKKESDRENYKNVMRISDMLNMASDIKYSTNSTYLVAISNIPIEYGFDFDGKSISKYDSTVIVQACEVEFRDKDNNLNYPLGHYQGVERETNLLHIEPYDNAMYGSGEGFIDYKIDDLDVVDLKVGYIEDDRNPVALKGKIYIYNFKNSNFEEIKYSKVGQRVENPADYINNGLITIKVEGDNEDGAAVPAIAVKGREK